MAFYESVGEPDLCDAKVGCVGHEGCCCSGGFSGVGKVDERAAVGPGKANCPRAKRVSDLFDNQSGGNEVAEGVVDGALCKGGENGEQDTSG